MLFNTPLSPPFIELRISISEAIEEHVLVVNLMGLNFGHMANWNLFGLISLGKQISRVANEKNASSKRSRMPSCTVMKSAILGDEKVGCPDGKGVQELGVNDIVALLQRPKLDGEGVLGQTTPGAQDAILFYLAKRDLTPPNVLVAPNVFFCGFVHKDVDLVRRCKA